MSLDDDPETAVYDEQEQWILENFGQVAVESANYGWYVDEIGGIIQTKVYGYGVLTTTIETLEHEWESYD